MANLSKLSPKAKKALIGACAPGAVTALVELAAGFTPGDDIPLQDLGATLRGWSEESRIMTLSIDVSHLDDLSDLRGVTYIEIGGKLANPGDPPE